MAQVVLSTVGGAVGGPLGAAIGAFAGRTLDRGLVGSLTPARRRGPELPGLRIGSAAEGEAVPAVFGRARVAGQMIWAARFRRRDHGSGSKGARVSDAAYSLSFAVAVGEGPIDGIGRVWADGKAMELSGVAMRLYRGTEDQMPDALIAVVEGSAPAYRGTAYVVFEDLPLGAYGNRPPQISVEVFRRPRGSRPSLESRLTSICLIPGAGEAAYATTPTLRREGLIRARAENVNNPQGRADLEVALDQLAARFPNLTSVNLVVAWFGDDLRCGVCRVRPGVESLTKATLPRDWRVNGVERAGAHLVSCGPEAPNYGGTPGDASVIEAVAAIRARGWSAVLYPFLMMDLPEGNGRPDPHGAAEQPAFPWRGRVTCHPAPGRGGSPDGTATAASQVAAFFGAAVPGDLGVVDGEVRWTGASGDWGWRRCVLHHARLAVLSGADGLVIGSEMPGLTTVRGADGGYPAVAALKALAQDCRAILGPDRSLTYAADWSEYTGHRPADGEVRFNLDPLWSDAAISHVGIDWYPPLTDWRDGDDHLDAGAWRTGVEPAYLAAGVAGGEGFDWFYADEAGREAQARLAITDGAHGEPWVFRSKDLIGWWSNPHHERIGGVRSAAPTAWVPGMKPIRFVEFGCPAVDRGGNAPNLFVDTKSAESALPPFSSGARDDRVQRRALEAVLGHFADGANNPVSTVYGGPMVDQMAAWCWDARPFPDFPARPDVWADARNWRTGHWLNGRASGEAVDLLQAVLGLGEVDRLSFEDVGGTCDGYVVAGPMRLSDAVAPLLTLLDATMVECADGLVVLGSRGLPRAMAEADLALPDDGEGRRLTRRLEAVPGLLRLRFVDGEGDYPTGSVTARADEGGELPADVDLPVVIGAAEASRCARRQLTLARGLREGLDVAISPTGALAHEIGDLLTLEGEAWRVTGVELDENPTLSLTPVVPTEEGGDAFERWRPGGTVDVVGPPFLAVLDLPPLPGTEGDARPLVAVAADPFRGMTVSAGPALELLTARGRAEATAVVGELTAPLAPGAAWRWDESATLTARFAGGSPVSVSAAAVLAGANTAAVKAPDGAWELLQYRQATALGDGLYRLSGLIRGRAGTEVQAALGAPTGADVVLVSGLARVESDAGERGLPLVWRATADGASPGGLGVTTTSQVMQGVWYRPFAPTALGVRAEDGDLRLGWVRRTRLGGDSWAGATPLSEEIERYRLRILDGAALRRTVEVNVPNWLYPTLERTADFPAGGVATMEVAQWSATWGWGQTARRAFTV